MLRWARAIALSLAGLLANAAHAQDGSANDDSAPQISLLTFGPGEIYWQRFGHNALLVRDGYQAQVYNYGIFDFHQKNFFLNFARGHMLYRLDREPLLRTLENYAADGRWVIEQELDLTPEQRRTLAARLAENALPQNAEYRYDYFIANCSTKVRDALDGVLGGQIEAALRTRPTPVSFRGEVLELMKPEPALMFGMDFGLGAVVDAPLDEWQDGFIPMRLLRSLRTVQLDVGGPTQRPLVRTERELVRVPGLAPKFDAPEASPPRAIAPFALAGLGWAALLLLGARFARRSLFAPLAGVQVLLSAIAGTVLLLGWIATEHWGMAGNANLLLINPLYWLLLPAVLTQFRRSPRTRSTALPFLLVLFALSALPLLYFSPQANAHWLALLLPAQLALLSAMIRRHRGAASG